MHKFVNVDQTLCIGCKTCMAACVVNHTGKRIFALQPDSCNFAPRIHVVTTKTTTNPVHCLQCPKPKCLEACPFGVITLGNDAVLLDETQCRGCGKCARACPFGAIHMTMISHSDTAGRPFRMVAYKCDLCAHTETGEPACIQACPTEALSLFDPVAARAKALAKAKAIKAAQQKNTDGAPSV
ncbi:MAG: 4Fe-4S dicluster domain-containing protein [Megasphaera sp.]|jgi:electron transport protein HydN|nr:4Fe-4S dicluster domain-containing protein [Megasphaera sp.]